MSLSLYPLLAAMTMRRRSDDDGQDTAITRYAKQVAPMVTAVLVAVGSYKYAPLPPGTSEERLAAKIEQGMTKISELTTQITVLEQSQKALTARMDEIYARRTAQVGDDWGAAQLAALKAQLRAQATAAMQAAAQRALAAIDNGDSLERLKEVYSRLTRTLGQFF